MFTKIIVFMFLFFKLNNAQDIVVTIPNGKLKGRLEYSLRNNVTFYAFQQIPYAKPPIGNLRFEDPQPADPWNGTLDATKNEKICYQVSDFGGLGGETEDCLFLNVYSPTYPSTSSSYPVIYFIHGGGYIGGASVFSQAGPHYLIESEVVVVTVNYRIGPFGFISTGDTVMPGNQALKDQNLGLQWVRDNIKYFGGDPEKVTIMGQSAGAASVTFQLISSKSKGLYRAAIAHSGSALCPWSFQSDPRSKVVQLATTIDKTINLNATSEELVTLLKNVTAKDIIDAAKAMPITVDNYQIVQGFFWAPVIEPEYENAFITESMYSTIEGGRMNRVPLLLGINSEEGLGAPNYDYFLPYLKEYDDDVKKLVNKNMHVSDNDTLEIIGDQIRKIYTNSLIQDDLSYGIRYFSDMSFTRSIIKHAHMQSLYSDVYFYQFSYDGKLGGEKIYYDGAEKVGHGEEGNYVWVYGNSSNLDSYPREDILTSDRFRNLLTNFVKYLDPTPYPSDLLENVRWPTVKNYNFKFLNINKSLTVESDPKNGTYPEWVQIYDDDSYRPFITY